MAKSIAVEAAASASPTTSTAASSEIPDAVRALAGEVAVLAAFEATIAPCEGVKDTILQFKKNLDTKLKKFVYETKYRKLHFDFVNF